ncbi:protein rolling stone-like [Antedon mediterranea]|uniref:protein rolling stone-like n=1 Tax=Antedon mediterranea TaxID=105859 RepID=UPI003AF8A2C9
MEGRGVSCNLLKLNSDKRLFVTSQFSGLNPHIFSIWRFIITLYFVAFNAWYIPYSVIDYGWTFFIYLTNWTFIVVTCYLLVASYNSCVYYYNVTRRGEGSLLVLESSEETQLPFKYKLQWFLFYISANFSIIVTVVYWAALYSDDSDSLFIDLNVHTLTSLIGILETFLSATPVRLIHVAYPLWYGTIYLFFTVIYWVAGGTDINGNTYIYPIIDYENEPVTAVLSILGCVAGAFVCQVLLWLIYNLRLKIASKLIIGERPEESRPTSDSTLL